MIAGLEWTLDNDICLKADKLAATTIVRGIRIAIKDDFKNAARIQKCLDEAGQYGTGNVTCFTNLQDVNHGWNEMAADLLDHLVFGKKRGTECDYLK